MRRCRNLRISGILSAAVLLASCIPSITVRPTENLDAGKIKKIKSEVKAACGYNNVSANFKKNTSATWINLTPVTRSGDEYSSDIPGSDNFAEGDTYDFRWAVDYSTKRKSFFDQSCESIPPATVVAVSSFTVPVCAPGSFCILPVAMHGQETSEWCWAASAQMIMAYLGTNVAQCTQANDRFNRADCCNDGGGTCGNLFTVITYLANHAACINPAWPDFGHYNFDAAISAGALSWTDLRKQLSDAPHCRRTPVAFTWDWTGGGAHMMVAHGYASVDIFAGNLDFVAIRDPWPPCSGDSKIITYDEYVARAGDHTHSIDYYNIRQRP